MLTNEIIAAAQANDLAATTAISEATEGRIQSLAAKFATRMGYGNIDHWRDEFAQVGRVAVWESLARFQIDTVDVFYAYTYRTAETVIGDHVRGLRNSGVDADAMKIYSSMMEAADGDEYEAEKLAQTLPPKGRRLSAERARAARMAWHGAVSIDAQLGNADGRKSNTLADSVQCNDETPDVNPKVGHGAALEALSVLERYAGVVVGRIAPAQLTEALPALVETLEDTVIVPRNPQHRRYVLDALRILRAAVSTSTDGELADDLRDQRDDSHADAKARQARVHDVLAGMGEGQRDVLRHTFGISGGMEFGQGDNGDLEGLAEYLGLTPKVAFDRREKGRRAFAKRYVARLRLEGAGEMAKAYEEGAALARTRGGRK